MAARLQSSTVLLLRLVRLVVVVVGYECIMNVLAWFSPLGHPAPQGRTGAPTRHGLGTRTPSSDTLNYHTRTASPHTHPLSLQACTVQYLSAPVHLHMAWAGHGALRETRESAGAPGVLSAVGDVTPDVTSECDA